MKQKTRTTPDKLPQLCAASAAQPKSTAATDAIVAHVRETAKAKGPAAGTAEFLRAVSLLLK